MSNIVSENNIYLNSVHGIYIFHAIGNLVYHNNIIDNRINARDDQGVNNKWYNSTINEGNYYSDYKGVDKNKDGIGDTPYSIPGSSHAVDLYPLTYKLHHFLVK